MPLDTARSAGLAPDWYEPALNQGDLGRVVPDVDDVDVGSVDGPARRALLPRGDEGGDEYGAKLSDDLLIVTGKGRSLCSGDGMHESVS